MSCYDCDIHPVSLLCKYCKRAASSAAVRRNCSTSDCGGTTGGSAAPKSGAGTELSALLSRLRITADESGCTCRSRAALMDANGCDWCEANIEEIVGWLRESAAERGLPFLDAAGRLLVRRAIANARRKEAANGAGPPLHPER